MLLLKNHFSNHSSGAYCAAPYCGTRQRFPQDTVENPGSPQDVLLILSSCRRFWHHGLIFLFGCLRLSPSLCYWQTTLPTYWLTTSSQETCTCYEMILTEQHFVSKIYAFYVRIAVKTTEEEGAVSKRLVFPFFNAYLEKRWPSLPPSSLSWKLLKGTEKGPWAHPWRHGTFHWRLWTSRFIRTMIIMNSLMTFATVLPYFIAHLKIITRMI